MELDFIQSELQIEFSVREAVLRKKVNLGTWSQQQGGKSDSIPNSLQIFGAKLDDWYFLAGPT